MTIENEASKLDEASPWAADKRAAEIVRPAPVQSADNVPPKSLARDKYQFSASLHEMEFVLGSTHVMVCDRGLDMHTTMRSGMR